MFLPTNEVKTEPTTADISFCERVVSESDEFPAVRIAGMCGDVLSLLLPPSNILSWRWPCVCSLAAIASCVSAVMK